MLLSQKDLVSVKTEILKDLEKYLKSGYKAQYKNIIFNILTSPKVFIKKIQEDDLSSRINKFNYINTSLTQHLIDIFDVFGDSAVLNAKMIFEENAKKWGKKILKRFKLDNSNIIDFMTQIYINVVDYDYLEVEDGRLIWHFYKSYTKDDCDRYKRQWNIFYDIKKIWMTALLSSLNCEVCFSDSNESNPEKVLTIIEIKKALMPS